MIDLKLGNCLDVLKTIEDNSVDSIVTDPPYGIDFMGKKWDYDVPSTEIWEQCLRVLKPGGYLLAFAGTRTQHRMAVRIEDAGFEIRDMIAWVYGSGFPKSHNISKAIDKMAGAEREVVSEKKTNSGGMAHISKTNAEHGFRPNAYTGNSDDKTAQNVIQVTAPATDEAKQWDGWGTALKPALEPITVARKPLEENTVAANVLKYGTGGINIDASRVPASKEDVEMQKKRTGGIGVSYTNTIYGKYETTFPAGNEIGRFPANLIHDGSDEVTELFPSQTGKSSGRGALSSGGNIYGNGNGIVGAESKGELIGYGDDGSAARFFYVPKTTKKDRNDGLDKFEAKVTASAEFRPNHMEKAEQGENGNPYGRWTPTKNNHPTVKPTDLMRYLVNMVTPKGGVTLDPFMGSGSTGRGAVLGKFDFIGIELDPDYYEIAKARIKAAEDSIGVSLEDFFE